MRYNRDFLLFSGKEPGKVDNEDIKKYLYYMIEKKNVLTSTLNIIINALKSYYRGVLKKKLIYEVKRPKGLLVILSKELDTITNIKHKAILMLMYSDGLRVGEIIKLKPEDMNGDRRLIFTKASKGRRGRYTLLSDVALKENSYPEGCICEQFVYLPYLEVYPIVRV